jgi:hypothetical protein
MAQNHLPSLAAPVLPVGPVVPAFASVLSAVSAIQIIAQRRLLFEKANAAVQKYCETLSESDFQIFLKIMKDYEEEDNDDSLADDGLADGSADNSEVKTSITNKRKREI